ncbi:MAG: methyltransferase domain-containing protein [Gemmatimonadaceae bacterium]
MNCNSAPGQYYAERSLEYERVYTKPERQADLSQLHTGVGECCRGRRVLEVACGTGYWTASAATTAAHITATDATPEVLKVARAKRWNPSRVQFQLIDAYELHVSIANVGQRCAT